MSEGALRVTLGESLGPQDRCSTGWKGQEFDSRRSGLQKLDCPCGLGGVGDRFRCFVASCVKRVKPFWQFGCCVLNFELVRGEKGKRASSTAHPSGVSHPTWRKLLA